MFSLAQEIVKKQFLGQFVNNSVLTSPINALLGVRWASKKAGGSSRNKKGHPRPKHRRIYFNDGCFVQRGSSLVLQNKLRFHPGLNVGFGRNGTLFALEAGKVVITCEKIDPNMNHTWIMKHYAGRDINRIYKKYFHVIPEKEHCNFKTIDSKVTCRER